MTDPQPQTELPHGTPVPLASVPLQRSGALTLQQRVLDLRATGPAEVLDEIARLHHLTDAQVIARHLVARHIERVEQRDWTSELSMARPDDASGDAARMDGTSLREAHQSISRVLLRPAVAVASAADFGELLALRFQAMGPGQVERHVLATDGHVLALELRTAATARMVRLYDPATATHLRLMVPHPDRLREPGRRSLQAWLGPACAEYFEATPEILTLHAWQPPAAAPAASALAAGGGEARIEPAAVQLVGLDRDAQLSAHFLRRVLTAGAASEVAACVRQGLGGLPGNSAQLMRFLQARSSDGQSGLEAAIVAGQADAAAAFVSTVATAPDWQLSQGHRGMLLRGASRNVQGELPAFNTDTVRASPQALVACVRAVLAAPPACVSAEQRIELLLARPTRGVPLLHALCSRAPRLAPEAIAVQEGLWGLAQAIAGAHVLSLRERQAVLAAKVSKGWWRSETAAAAAIAAGNPEAAAALACGVFDSRADAASRQALLAAMDIKPGEVLRALGRLPASRRDRWKPRLATAIEHHARPAMP